VLAPEGQAGLHAPGFDEHRPVGGPVLGRAGRRRHDQALHRRVLLRLSQLRLQLGHIPTLGLGQLLRKAHQVLAAAIGPGGGILDRLGMGLGFALLLVGSLGARGEQGEGADRDGNQQARQCGHESGSG